MSNEFNTPQEKLMSALSPRIQKIIDDFNENQRTGTPQMSKFQLVKEVKRVLREENV